MLVNTLWTFRALVSLVNPWLSLKLKLFQLFRIGLIWISSGIEWFRLIEYLNGFDYTKTWMASIDYLNGFDYFKIWIVSIILGLLRLTQNTYKNSSSFACSQKRKLSNWNRISAPFHFSILQKKNKLLELYNQLFEG